MKTSRSQVGVWGGFVVFLTCLFAVGNAAADYNYWINMAGGSWEVPANWSLNRAPTNTDSMVINTGTYTVNVDNITADTDPGGDGSWMTVQDLFFDFTQGGMPTLVIDFTNALRTFQVTRFFQYPSSYNSSARVILNNGHMVTYEAIVGTYGGVSGGLSELIVNGGRMDVTEANAGLMVGGINSGGINPEFATGIVVLAGGEINGTNNAPQSTYIGNYGDGIVIISNGVFRFADQDVSIYSGSRGHIYQYGGTNECGRLFQLGCAKGAFGEMIVAGGEFVRASGYSYSWIGNAGGQGTLSVTNTGRVILDGGGIWRVYVGATAGSVGTLNVYGGTLTVLGATTFSLGEVVGATGRVTITGGQVAMSNATIIVGNSGVGDMTVSNVALQALQNLTLAANGGAEGRLTMGNGGTVAIAGALTVNAGGAITNHLTGFSGGIDLAAAATVNGNGTMDLLFEDPPREETWWWGLRWEGNHTNDIQILQDAGKLTWSGNPKVHIYRDASYSYVGFYSKPLQGVILQIQ